MGLTMVKMSTIVMMFGLISFVLGIVGENKKPSMGILVQAKDAMMCKYPSDPTVALGYCSFAFLIASSSVGLVSIFYSYNAISVPPFALFKYTTLFIFFTLAFVLAAAMTLWPTMTEQHHLTHNVYIINTSSASANKPDCPTAKTGVMGGATFLCFISSLFWLMSLMLVNNARDDYFEELNPSV